ncbi:NEAT domain-containing protein [Paenibacillus agaridevorans]|uniref:NEAT domain-containing protein n=1 Tax=Paenibacillus agaridevorans TaxID=171404 RepID=UPI001BE4BAED|nr:NEAT domain-containing protein [Paenibacillus agaridevorans]
MLIKKSLQRYMSILLACFLLLSAVPVAAADADPAPATKVPDGEYEVGFRILKNGSTEGSYAEDHLASTIGKLVVLNGNYKLQVSFINYDWYEYWGSLKPGGAPGSDEVAAEAHYEPSVEVAVSDGHAIRGPQQENKLVQGYNGTVEFPIHDIRGKQEVLMHIIVKDLYLQAGGEPLDYDHWYRAQVVVDVSNLPFVPIDNNPDPGGPAIDREELLWQITVTQALYTSTEGQEGAWHGAYASGARASLAYAIGQAQAVADNANATDEEIGAAYTALTGALNLFKQQRVKVDKSVLLARLVEAEAFAAGLAYVPNAGLYIEGAIGALTPATMDSSITSARTVYNDPLATQAQVEERITALATTTATVNNSRLFAIPSRLIVLDSLDANATESPKSSLFGPTAMILKRNTLREHANIAISDSIAIDNVNYFRPNTDGSATFAVDPLVPVHANVETAGFYTIQAQHRTSTMPSHAISGLIKLEYSTTADPGVIETVYLSLNGTLLDNLNADIAEAQALFTSASTGERSGQYDEASLADLQAAIDEAIATGSRLSATRPNITSASTALGNAVQAFLTSQRDTLQFTVAHATDAGFSMADDFLSKPARATQESDSLHHVILNIPNSSQLVSFQYKQADAGYTEAEVLYTSESEDYRVVLLQNISLSALLEARMHVVIPHANYDQTHNVRLNFNGVNNSQLSAEYKSALTQWRGARAGSEIGEYPAEAMASYKTAIDTAGQEAIALNGSQIKTDAALLVLRLAVSAFEAAVNTTNTGTPSNPNNPGNPSNPGNQGPQYPADGNYLMDFTVLKKGTESVSVMNQYVFTTALVKVAGGNKTVSFTLKQSKEVTGFTLNGGSGGGSGTDSSTNTRVVTFSLSDLSGKIPGWVSIYWDLSGTIPGFIYDEQYDVDFKFNESSAKNAGDQTIPPGGNGNGGMPPGLEPPGSGSGGPTPDDGKEDPGSEGEPGEEETTSEEEGNGTPTVPFSDTTNHWAKSTIEQAVKLGIVNGFSDGSFRPNNIVTRGEFAVMISRALGLDGEGDADALQDFGSIPAWAQPHVARVVTAGLIGGFEDATFRSGGRLTRAQLAVIISRAAGLKPDDRSSLSFNDADSVPAWAQREVAAAVAAGLIQGKDGNRFAPNATATRAEALTLIIRLLERL